MISKEEALAALKLLSDESSFNDWTASVNAYHTLKKVIMDYYEQSFKNKDRNLNKLRVNIKTVLNYDQQSLELEIFDKETKEVLKTFKFKKKEVADFASFESVFNWLEEYV